MKNLPPLGGRFLFYGKKWYDAYMIKIDIDIVNGIIQYGEIAAGLGTLGLLYFKYRANTLEERRLKKALWFVALFFAAMTAVKIAGKYYFLATDLSFGKLMLPPHQSWAWFAQTALQKHLAPYVVALAFGAFMYQAARRTNAYFDGDLFLAHDKYILFMAALITGWPGFMLYLATVVALALTQSLFSSLRHKTTAVRVILTHALIIAVPLVLFLSGFVAPYIYLWKLTI